MGTCLSGSRASCATANIPNRPRRAEKAPLQQSILFPRCNLTRKRKQTRPCNDYPTSSIHVILRPATDSCLITLDHREMGAQAEILKPAIPVTFMEPSSGA